MADLTPNDKPSPPRKQDAAIRQDVANLSRCMENLKQELSLVKTAFLEKMSRLSLRID